jgi:hypothetical protein
MGKLIGFATMACIVGAACGSSAQAQKPAVEPAGDITIIGCVEPTDRSTPAGKMADTKYMLTRAKEGKASGTTAGTTGSTAGTTGAAGTAGTSASGSRTYQLDAQDSKIAPEVGHVVEIVAAAPEPDPSGKTPKLKVQTIRFIAAACPPQ